MKIYLSIGGGQTVRDMINKYDLAGWCIAPDKVMNPGDFHYILDNGAFHAWNHGKTWSENRFKRLVQKFPGYDFVVAPDIVCGGDRSLRKSLEYTNQIPGPLYLAVQDGMNAKDVCEHIDLFDGLFIGGSISWKFQTARMWSQICKLYKKKCHAGNVNSYEGLIHMHFSGVDSVDGSTASRHQDDTQIRKYFDHLKTQTTLIDKRQAGL